MKKSFQILFSVLIFTSAFAQEQKDSVLIVVDSSDKNKIKFQAGAGVFISADTRAFNYCPSFGINYKKHTMEISFLIGPKINAYIESYYTGNVPSSYKLYISIPDRNKYIINGINLFYMHHSLSGKRLKFYWEVNLQFLDDKFRIENAYYRLDFYKNAFGVSGEFGFKFNINKHLSLKSGLGLGLTYYNINIRQTSYNKYYNNSSEYYKFYPLNSLFKLDINYRL